ncbi:hypothetical protein [Actinomadura bangladeshensis]|uniref:Uncharacterized protein n=1 Tax=Actinomadura bangladeshensis TaxID=453573 RepID=A0A6L9Q905_9ACTN|nr:hypothetical protein [Actinomadura bangladeshensis]NEA21980.1 hypothetical protein [Actinomadura bangladeshensis]
MPRLRADRVTWRDTATACGITVWNEQLQRAAAASERRRYHQRSLLHDQLVGEEFAGLRAWLREQAALLEMRKAAALCRRLWDERRYWSAVYELAAGAALRRAGPRPLHEQRWDQPGGGVQTPDRACTTRRGGWSRWWRCTPTRPRPPTGKVAKQLVAGLRANLRQVELTGGFTGHGYHLRILADRTGRPVQAPVGLRAQLAWPTPTAGRVDADKFTRKIEGKASKYRALAAELGVPLVIAVGAEPFTASPWPSSTTC